MAASACPSARRATCLAWTSSIGVGQSSEALVDHGERTLQASGEWWPLVLGSRQHQVKDRGRLLLGLDERDGFSQDRGGLVGIASP